ncbi:unnamed protein product [Musa acuminata subsp. malaccensis]|uniref:(wild Malaysian banana) hypothetical protein n=1 Tax=Musa acuminata subsp. malaccensis TaxID=214687 RepID=A0A804KXG9_MUSAM|nr:unnamed protein product [Musa acuminata subsp. malaccensis]
MADDDWQIRCLAAGACIAIRCLQTGSKGKHLELILLLQSMGYGLWEGRT